MADDRAPNSLIREKSPYLLQHAHNPVDWHSWGEEAFSLARNENKPIFLSVGYSTCHWCHVMERESFENAETAAILNREFVPIKVDREERPDIDNVYMKAVVSLTGQGGWPLSAFLTPNLMPFYGGTYFPPTPMHGLPSFKELLNFIAGIWKEKRQEVEQNARSLTESIKRSYLTGTPGPLSNSLLDGGYGLLISNFDQENGGYGGPPKFPLPSNLGFLMRYYLRTGKKLALGSVLKTLDCIRDGGINDQVGGGFHRYSTDRYWLVPHFEKMLYDNALLAKVYLEAYQVSRNPSYADCARNTLDWMTREMRSPEGGFYSAQDADTEEGEGVYYTWTREDVDSALGARVGEIVSSYYGITSIGNLGGRSIPHVAMAREVVIAKFDLGAEQFDSLLAGARRSLLETRRGRTKPSVDDKVLTSWNGLTISAFACAYQATGEKRYLETAVECCDFVRTRLMKDGTLLRRYREGEAALEGTLEDYSFFVAGLMDSYEASFDAELIELAVGLCRKMVDLFWDEAGGGFFLNPRGDELLVPVKDSYDGPTPSGNSAAVLDLLRAAEFTGDSDLKAKAEKTLRLFADGMETEPAAHTHLLSALDFFLGPTKEVVLAVDRQDSEFESMARELRSRFMPNKVLALSCGKDTTGVLSNLTGGKVPAAGKPTVYICENFACEAPINEIESLREALGP